MRLARWMATVVVMGAVAAAASAAESPYVRQLRDQAKEGNRKAEVELGLRLRSGDGVTRDEQGAVELFRKAAEAGAPHAAACLGEMYENGRGVVADPAVAVTWYRRGVEQRDPAAMLDLALCLASGTGVPRDVVEGYSWVEVAQKIAEGPIKSRVSGMRFGMRMRILKAQATEAEQRAEAWLAAHP